MGWNSGGEIFDIVAEQLDRQFGTGDQLNIPVLRSRKVAVLRPLIAMLEDRDCDVLDESFGISEAGDLALAEMGYHHEKRDCEWVGSGMGDKCTCGWKAR